MSNTTVAIKIKTPSGERYFCGFGKKRSVQTAWSIAGAKLFLQNAGNLTIIVNFLEAKKKKVTIVTISECQPHIETINSLNDEIATLKKELNLSKTLQGPQGFVWMTREEFNHYTAISNMKPVNMEFIRQFALEQLETSKFAATVDFWNCDGTNVQFMREDAFEWAQLARGLSREIRKMGGL